MRNNECPICHRYFPVGLWHHVDSCAANEAEKAPNGYRDLDEYIKAKRDAARGEGG